MEEVELQKGNKEPRRFNKWTLIKFLIALAVGLLIAFLIYLTEYYNDLSSGNQVELSTAYPRYLADAFGLSGLLLLLFAAINFVACKGAFDILNYSMQLLFLTIFRPSYREKKFPKTYYDYKVQMDLKERKPINILWIVGLAFLLTGLIFLGIYNTSI